MYKVIDPLFENTKCEARVGAAGTTVSYRIRPAEGYKLHEKTLDEYVVDEKTGSETEAVKLGYTKSYITAGVNYDFIKNKREIYSVKDE